MQYAKESNNVERELKVLQFLAEGKFKNSSEFAKNYFELNENQIYNERSVQDKFARIEFETDEIEKENLELARQRKIWIGIALFALVIGLAFIIVINQSKANQRLKFEQEQQKTNEEIYNLMLSQKAKMEEGKKSAQKRISEELHDSVLGQMLGLRLMLTGLNEKTDTSSIEERASLITKLQGVEEEIRTMSHDLNAAAYHQVDNFLLSITELVNTFEKSTTIKFNLDYDADTSWNTLPGEIKINIYRILQEAIKNSIKHAQCDTITLKFQEVQNNGQLIIKDNGIGFKVKNTKTGIGLRNIASRINKINATFKVESEIGKGTSYLIDFPFAV